MVWGVETDVHSQECFSSRSRAGLNLTSDLLYNDALLSSMATLAIFTALLDSCGHSSRVRPAWKGYFSVIQSPPDKSHGCCICWKVHNGPIVNCCMSLWRGVLRDKLVIQAGQGSVQKLAGQRTKKGQGLNLGPKTGKGFLFKASVSLIHSIWAFSPSQVWRTHTHTHRRMLPVKWEASQFIPFHTLCIVGGDLAEELTCSQRSPHKQLPHFLKVIWVRSEGSF